MRTTLSIDDDLLAAAKSLARARSVSVGAVISELARCGLKPAVRARDKNGFPVFRVSNRGRPLTLEDVRKIEDQA